MTVATRTTAEQVPFGRATPVAAPQPKGPSQEELEYAEFAGSPKNTPAVAAAADVTLDVAPPEPSLLEPSKDEKRMSRKQKKAAKKKAEADAQIMDDDLAFTLGALSQAAASTTDQQEAQGINAVTEAALSPTSIDSRK